MPSKPNESLVRYLAAHHAHDSISTQLPVREIYISLVHTHNTSPFCTSRGTDWVNSNNSAHTLKVCLWILKRMASIWYEKQKCDKRGLVHLITGTSAINGCVTSAHYQFRKKKVFHEGQWNWYAASMHNGYPSTSDDLPDKATLISFINLWWYYLCHEYLPTDTVI